MVVFEYDYYLAAVLKLSYSFDHFTCLTPAFYRPGRFNLSCTCSKLILFSVNYKVLTYLRSPNWDTRIAAGQAVEAIVKNIPEWDPAPKPKEGKFYNFFPEICGFSYILVVSCWCMRVVLNT